MENAKSQVIPDRLYALVMEKNGAITRKYACIDKKSTKLSLNHFNKHWQEFPLSAAKTAAANLDIACDWYNIRKPEVLNKLAALASTALMGGLMYPYAKDMSRKGKSKTIASLERAGFPTPQLPQQKVASLQPYIKVASYERPITEELETIKASQTKPGLKLASITDLYKAVDLFKDRSISWDGKQKVAFCQPLVKFATRLGLQEGLPHKVRVYGNTKQASMDRALTYIETRKQALTPTALNKYAYRLAQEWETSPDEDLAEKIARVDKEFGIRYHSNMPDPWEAVYGKYKTAEYIFTDNGKSITEEELKRLAKNSKELEDTFSKEIINAFREEPVRIFSSLPLDQKKVFINAIQRTKKE